MANSSEHRRNTELLRAELPDPRFADDGYLRWLYEENPQGSGITVDIDEEGVRVAHFAVIPQLYRRREQAEPLAFSLNAVTRSGQQRRGLWTEVGRQVFENAAEAGRKLVVGVTNQRSTHGAVKHLGYRLVGPLPVYLLVPGSRGRSVRSLEVSDVVGDQGRFADLVRGIDGVTTDEWAQWWTAEQLAWRLRRPHASYSLHVEDRLVGVSSVTRIRGLRLAVIVALLPRGPIEADGVIPARHVVAAACRHHRVPAAVYAGFNPHVPVRGLPVPRRFRPAPLNLVCRSLSDEMPADSFGLSRFEFLDMDAY